MAPSKKRVHGMQAPFHPLQILTWIIYPLLIVQYFLLVMPLLNSLVVKIITACIFGISAVVALGAGGLTATINPADDACLGIESAEEKGPTLLCYLCETYVESTSKHCRTCGKCVQNFDHHCKWLNTCVGKKNYRYFLILMGAVAVMTTLSLALCAYLVAMCFLDKNVIEDRIDDAFSLNGILNYWAVVSLLIVSMAVLLPLVLLLYQLIGFHAMLVRRGITTYDYIVSEQKRLREKKKAALAAKTASTTPTSSSSRLPTQTPAPSFSSAVNKEVELAQTYAKAKQNDEDDDEDGESVSDNVNSPGAYINVDNHDNNNNEEEENEENDTSMQVVVSNDKVQINEYDNDEVGENI